MSDVQPVKEAILREMSKRVVVSGGPEVFRRLASAPNDLGDAALAELVRDGWLKRTDLRVGCIYHYPANTKPSLDLLDANLREERAASKPAAGGVPPTRKTARPGD
jgi:hypothetical protein